MRHGPGPMFLAGEWHVWHGPGPMLLVVGNIRFFSITAVFAEYNWKGRPPSISSAQAHWAAPRVRGSPPALVALRPTLSLRHESEPMRGAPPSVQRFPARKRCVRARGRAWPHVPRLHSVLVRTPPHSKIVCCNPAVIWNNAYNSPKMP